jgi:hypothetical protein
LVSCEDKAKTTRGQRPGHRSENPKTAVLEKRVAKDGEGLVKATGKR